MKLKLSLIPRWWSYSPSMWYHRYSHTVACATGVKHVAICLVALEYLEGHSLNNEAFFQQYIQHYACIYKSAGDYVFVNLRNILRDAIGTYVVAFAARQPYPIIVDGKVQSLSEAAIGYGSLKPVKPTGSGAAELLAT